MIEAVTSEYQALTEGERDWVDKRVPKILGLIEDFDLDTSSREDYEETLIRAVSESKHHKDYEDALKRAVFESRFLFPEAFEVLHYDAPVKVFYGGRGSAKSWSVAKWLVLEMVKRPIKVLCAREFQTSLADSVKSLLEYMIRHLGLEAHFHITDKSISTWAGGEFLFRGIKINPQSVRSLEGIDICWVEEAHVVSKQSWLVLMPTLFRVPGCQLIITFNPDQEGDPTYVDFVVNRYPRSIVKFVNWDDNPFFPPDLDEQRRYMLEIDPVAYEWVWGGHTRKISDAVIFAKRVSIETFDTPESATFRYGADWGFGPDPAVLTRSWIANEQDPFNRVLYIDYEAYGWGVELDDLPALWDTVPGSRNHQIMADNSNPAQIAFMKARNFYVTGADKWPGSVEDGINFLKSFKKIVIHERCPHIGREARLYSYKVDQRNLDPKTNQPTVLPQIVDKHNHGWDCERYALTDLIVGDKPLTISDDIVARARSMRRR